MPEQKNHFRETYGGSVLLDLREIPLTDASPTYSVTKDAAHVGDLMVDMVADKGCNVVVTPVHVADDDSEFDGLAGDALAIADGGGKVRGKYSDLGAKKVKVVATKTEAGNMANFKLIVRGRE